MTLNPSTFPKAIEHKCQGHCDTDVSRTAMQTRCSLSGVVPANQSQEENPPEKKPPIINNSSEEVFLNNFRCVPESCHREEVRSSREVFEKARVNAVFFGGFWVGFWASNQTQERPVRESVRKKRCVSFSEFGAGIKQGEYTKMGAIHRFQGL